MVLDLQRCPNHRNDFEHHQGGRPMWDRRPHRPHRHRQGRLLSHPHDPESCEGRRAARGVPARLLPSPRRPAVRSELFWAPPSALSTTRSLQGDRFALGSHQHGVQPFDLCTTVLGMSRGCMGRSVASSIHRQKHPVLVDVRPERLGLDGGRELPAVPPVACADVVQPL